MSQKTFWQIQYFGLCINAFAQKFRLSPQIAHNYLRKYTGLYLRSAAYTYEYLKREMEEQK